MVQELEALSREAAASHQNEEPFLVRLTEVELATRASHALQSRITRADFPVTKDFDTEDFAALPSLSKPKLLELARCAWVDQKINCCFIGSPGTGTTH